MHGRVVAVRQIACPLWEGIDRLDAALAAASGITGRAERSAVTMTAELTEIFPSRRSGVDALVGHLVDRLSGDVAFFMGLKGFGDAAAARANPDAVGSANFLATAHPSAGCGRRLCSSTSARRRRTSSSAIGRKV